MTTYSPELDAKVEAEVQALLVEHYAPSYKERVNAYIDTIMATEHFAERLLYLRSVTGENIFNPRSTIFVSGFGTGSEMIMARQFGFGKVYGVEIEQILVEAAKKRLSQFLDMYPSLYDGDHLPYDDSQFNVVLSGHVIEHTNHPDLYIQELLRVLVPKGYLFLEFPHRFYRLELHTGLVSFEWLPKSLRNRLLLFLASNKSFLNEEVKRRYFSIVDTNLQQISLGGVMRAVKKSGYAATLVNRVKAAPGIIRCVIRRDQGQAGQVENVEKSRL